MQTTEAAGWTGRRPARLLLVNVLVGACMVAFSAACTDRGEFSVGNLMVAEAGIGLAALLIVGLRVLPGVFAGELLVERWLGVSFLDAVAYGGVDALASALGALVMTRLLGFRVGLERLRDLGGLVVVGVFAAPACAALLTALLFSGLDGMPWSFFLMNASHLWVMTAIGVLVCAPPLLCWTTSPRPTARRTVEAALLALGILVTGFVAWRDPWNLAENVVVLAFLPFIFPVWAAFRFGARGAALASFLVAVLCLWGTASGTGPLARDNNHVSTYLLFGFIAVPACTSLFTAAVLSERKRIEHEHRRLQARVQEAQKLASLGLLAGGIAHDFNNLLTPVLGGLGLLEDQLHSVPQSRETLADMTRATEQARDLCRQMMAYGGKAGIERRSADLSRIVSEMKGLLNHSLTKSVRLVDRLAPDLPAVEVDVTQLQQVILNLVANASDAMEDGGGTILVRTGVRFCSRATLLESVSHDEPEAGDYVFIEVVDEGHGMDADVVRTMFDPFFTTKETGRGLGLAATLGIVRAHGGAIAVDTGVGRGTTITIYLPPKAARADAEAEPALHDPQLQSHATILVVDDEPMIRSLVRRILQGRELSVIEAADGLQAIEVFRGHPEIDLVILDLSMPELDGYQTFVELQRIRAEVPVLLSSGFDETGKVGSPLDVGFAGFLQKPYSSAALLERIAEVLVACPTGARKLEPIVADQAQLTAERRAPQ